MLPTLNSMHARHPDLYPDSVCCVCDIQDEDNGHLWTCSAIRSIHQSIWQQALARIDGWGRAATVKYNKDNDGTPALWICPAEEVHFQGLSSIRGSQSILRGDDSFDRSPDLVWSAGDLYRGITPRSLIKEWSKCFQSPGTVARKVIHQFVGYLEKQATELIWKPRCTLTIAREKELGITAKSKRTPYTGPRGDWSDGYGYITAEGDCPCGSALVEHSNGCCPGPKLDPDAADRNLLESLLGKRRLTLMEGMGRIPFL